jgi:hypothetical protein
MSLEAREADDPGYVRRETAAEPSESFRPSGTMSDPIAFLQRVPECPAVPSHAIPEVHPKTNIDPTIDLWPDAQRPYGLIRPHHVFSEPSRLRRLVGVRHVPHFGRPNSPGLQA